MAGGVNTRNKQNETLVRTGLSLSSNRHSHLHCKYNLIKSKRIDDQERQKFKLLSLRNINRLQQDIIKIVNESLHCDLKIIHKHKVIFTNQCIIRIRSPWFYNIVRPHLSYRNETALCYIRQPGIYRQVKNFVRLLYTNLDISQYEQFLIDIIINDSCTFSGIPRKSEREHFYNKNLNYYISHCSFRNVTSKISSENSPTSSDMADSGLETGSMISPQETVSENSTTDLEEPNEAVVHKSGSISQACQETCFNNIHAHDPSKGIVGINDEISEYENRVLNDPFYESNDESDNDDNHQIHMYMPTTSFQFTEPQSTTVNIASSKKIDDSFLKSDQIAQNGKKPNITIERQQGDTNTSATNNYYFIDASSLNDDIDVPTTNVVGYPNDLNGSLAWSNPQLPSSCYIPTSKSNNFFISDDPFKLSHRKSANVQNQYQEIVELEKDIKLSEYLEPFTESRKVKKFDSQQIQDNLNGCNNTNKESLVVEIKEADSGESAQHSPCPDNTKIDSVQKVQERLSKIDLDLDLEVQQKEDAERRPSLIRRNTFELDANDEKLSSLRQEYERRQGNLVFQNSITQYSQHRIDGEPYFDDSVTCGSTVNDKVSQSDSQIVIASTSNFVLDKYDLDTTEKENKLSTTNDECAAHSIARSASDKFLVNCEAEDDIAFQSLPVTINDELGINSTKSKLRRNEAAPIISGGSSSSDFQKPTDSPIIKRKTESTPIVSGGSIVVSETQAKDKFKNKSNHMSSSMTAWVVDMSDCRSTEKPSSSKKVKESQALMSSSFSPLTNSEKEQSKEKEQEKVQHSSLGYFVNLEDIKSPRESGKHEIRKHRRRPSDTGSEKSYCEFFVDLSDKSSPNKLTSKQSESVVASPVAPKRIQESINDSKRNMFSMFIDLSEPETPAKKNGELTAASSSKFVDEQAQKKDSDDQSTEERKPKSGVFMFIESDSPLVRRRTLSSSRPAFKRHSWNTDKVNEEPTPCEPSTIAGKRVHKRAHSLSVDRVGDFRKLLGHKSSNSSHSLHETITKLDQLESDDLKQQKEDEKRHEIERKEDQETHQKQEQEMGLSRGVTEDALEYDFRDTPPNSHVEIMTEELLVSLKNRNYQELGAVNEETNKNTNTKTSTQPDECCSESSETNQTRKSETFDISSSASGPSSASDNLDFKVNDLLDATQTKLVTTRATKNQDIRLRSNEKVMKSNFTKTAPPSSFVRLSDLDKRPLSQSTNASFGVVASHVNAYRLSNSVTETSWIESKLSVSTRSNEPLHRALSKKLPLSGSLKHSDNLDEFGTEGDAEAFISESDLSSLQSSMGRSGQGSTEETETSTSFALGKPYNRLGEDLLRMFLEEINPDVTIDVGGRRIRAHKCILSSRCQYFAAILSGGWIESAGNIISLQGYSYNAVHFALCHIYSGESCIPDSISIVELATLADMLCLEGLKEVIGFTLKVKYCHLFHKPCTGCAVGVLECMPLAAAYGLDEVYRKSLRWVTRHFVRIWPSKEFATLPRELMDKCYNQHIVHMSPDNVLQTIMDCDKLLTTLPNVRWAEPVFRLVSNLLDASMKYLTDNFSTMLANESFQSLDRELTWNISRLEDHLLAAAERLPPEQACRAYSKLDKMFNSTLLDDIQPTKYKWSPIFNNLMNKIRGHVEKCLVRDAARAARTNAWLKMDLELRRRIQELACLVILPNEVPTKRPSRHSNFLKEPKERLEQPKIPISRTPPNRNLDLRRVKMAISEHNDRTSKQTPLLQTRKVMNKPKTDPLERKLQNDKLSIDSNSVSRPKSWPNKIEVKSRYLEPRSRLTVKEPPVQGTQEKNLVQQRKKIMISSSDSSRTSSPAMKRAAEKKSLSKVSKLPMKKDGKALSSDSLTESSSRLSIKKDVASKSCGITRPESPSLKAKESLETGLSVDSLAESKKKPLVKKMNKMDTSMSTDSLMTDITTITTPKSMATNKSSPILGKTSGNININQARNYDKLKKSSPPTQQRNTPSAVRRPARSLESSTAASRSRAAATVNTYQGSLSLRRSLLDAAKAPDIPSRVLNTATTTRTNLRQNTHTVRSSYAGLNKTEKCEKKDDSNTNNQRSSSSPASKRSPKSNVNSRLTKSSIATNKQKANKVEDKSSNKGKSQTSNGTDRDGPKFLNQSSRSGTFLKDEPTILNKSDIETAAIDV